MSSVDLQLLHYARKMMNRGLRPTLRLGEKSGQAVLILTRNREIFYDTDRSTSPFVSDFIPGTLNHKRHTIMNETLDIFLKMLDGVHISSEDIEDIIEETKCALMSHEINDIMAMRKKVSHLTPRGNVVCRAILAIRDLSLSEPRGGMDAILSDTWIRIAVEEVDSEDKGLFLDAIQRMGTSSPKRPYLSKAPRELQISILSILTATRGSGGRAVIRCGIRQASNILALEAAIHKKETEDRKPEPNMKIIQTFLRNTIASV